jgi:hypothetical protein
MTSLDLFYFEVPVLAQNLFQDQSNSMVQDKVSQLFAQWNSSLQHRPELTYEQPKMSAKCNNPTALKERLSQNNIQFLKQAQTTNGIPCFYLFAESVQGSLCLCEVSINVQQGNKVVLKAWSEEGFFAPLCIQAISFVLGAE